MPDDIRHLAKTLRLLSGSAFSQASADTLNRIANAANGEQGRNLRRDFTLRNKYTQGSLMMFKATPRPDAAKINALVGSKSPYLDEQEAGGEAQTYQGRAAKTMPALGARRGTWGRAVVSRYRQKTMGAIGRRGSNRRMRPKGAKFFWLAGGKLKNETLFTRGPGGKLVRVRLKTRGPVRIAATHWHSRAMAKAGRPALMSAAYGVELNRQLTKLGAR